MEGTKHKKASKIIVTGFQWSRRESNPGPNISAISFLHVYFCIICREMAGAKLTNHNLSRMVLSNSHDIELQHPVIVLSRRGRRQQASPISRP